MRFKDKTVLITGAAGGFGASTAARFAAEGAHLVLSDQNEGALDALGEKFSSQGTSVETLNGDVRDPAFHQTLVKCATDAFGRLDVAINNAGIVNKMARLEAIDPVTAQQVIDVDLMGVFYALQAQLPVMSGQFERTGEGGVIVNIASVAGLVGSPFLSIYSAAKHAVIGLTKAAAAENAKKGVRVNAVCPAFARTAMFEDAVAASPHSAERAAANILRGVPMGRVGEIEEVTQAIVFAASPENSFMTGETLSIDGGLSAI